MQKACKIEGCDRPVNAKGMCSSHYNRMRRYGNPHAGSTDKGALRRFIRDVAIPYAGDDCLIWPFASGASGQSLMRRSRDDKHQSAARIVCEEAHGAPPDPSHHAAHSCGNGHMGCVTPRHLRWATPAENSADMIIHGTSPKGEQNGNARLSESDVVAIRSLVDHKSQRAIAKQFGVSQYSIWSIVNGRHWSWL